MIVLWRSYQFNYVQFLWYGRRWLDLIPCYWLSIVGCRSWIHKFLAMMAWYNLISLESLNNFDSLVFYLIRWTHELLQASLRRHWYFLPQNVPLISRWNILLIRLSRNRMKLYFLRSGADHRFWWIFLSYSFRRGWTLLFSIWTIDCLSWWVPFRLGPRCPTASNSSLLLIFNCLRRPASWLCLPLIRTNTCTMSLLLLRCILLISRVSLLFLLNSHRYFRL